MIADDINFFYAHKKSIKRVFEVVNVGLQVIQILFNTNNDSVVFAVLGLLVLQT